MLVTIGATSDDEAVHRWGQMLRTQNRRVMIRLWILCFVQDTADEAYPEPLEPSSCAMNGK